MSGPVAERDLESAHSWASRVQMDASGYHTNLQTWSRMHELWSPMQRLIWKLWLLKNKCLAQTCKTPLGHHGILEVWRMFLHKIGMRGKDSHWSYFKITFFQVWTFREIKSSDQLETNKQIKANFILWDISRFFSLCSTALRIQERAFSSAHMGKRCFLWPFISP